MADYRLDTEAAVDQTRLHSLTITNDFEDIFLLPDLLSNNPVFKQGF